MREVARFATSLCPTSRSSGCVTWRRAVSKLRLEHAWGLGWLAGQELFLGAFVRSRRSLRFIDGVTTRTSNARARVPPPELAYVAAIDRARPRAIAPPAARTYRRLSRHEC